MGSIDWAGALTILNGIFMLLVIVGGSLALRYGIAKTTAEVQDRVREALKDENELLQSRVNRLEAENRRLSDLMQLIIAIFDKRGITVEIRDTMVEVRDRTGGSSTTGNTVQYTKPPQQP